VAGGDGAALAQASSKALGGVAWDEFSGVCWLFGRDIHNALGKRQTGGAHHSARSSAVIDRDS
jgi:hypothetical protein